MLETLSNADDGGGKVPTQENERVSDSISREEFDSAVASYYHKNSAHNRSQYWTKSHVMATIKLVEEYKLAPSLGQKRSAVHYNRGKLYDIMEVGTDKCLVLKRRTCDSPVVQIVPCEEYYDILNIYHESTGHGGRDKMTNALKHKYVIPRPVLELFLASCKTCYQKKVFPKAGVVTRNILNKDFNSRGQVNLIDFQSAPDGEFKWLLNYQDHATKFTQLRPLTSKRAVVIAHELLKIFLEVGCPSILHSDNDCDFTAGVIKELISMWPNCTIVNGRSQHPTSQDSVERRNQDVEHMLMVWMNDNNCRKWSIGCYFVQWQKNTSYHSNKSPYHALFGCDPKVGLTSTNIPREMLINLKNEEELEVLLKDYNVKENEVELSSTHHQHSCTRCNQVHDSNTETLCELCQREDGIDDERRKTLKGQKRAAEAMLEFSSKNSRKLV